MWLKIFHAFCSKFSRLSSSEKIEDRLIIGRVIASYIPVWVPGVRIDPLRLLDVVKGN